MQKKESEKKAIQLGLVALLLASPKRPLRAVGELSIRLVAPTRTEVQITIQA